jgi:hypothetical protein
MSICRPVRSVYFLKENCQDINLFSQNVKNVMHLQDACKVRSAQVRVNRKKSKRMSLSALSPDFSPKNQKSAVQSGITLKIGLKHYFFNSFQHLFIQCLDFFETLYITICKYNDWLYQYLDILKNKN